MQNYLIDTAGRRWNIRRTCVDIPGRTYAARLVEGTIDDTGPLRDIVGFYAATIDEIRYRLGAC